MTTKQTSDIVLADDLPEILETPITLRGLTIARFLGDRIAELRQYSDEVPLRESLGLIPAD